MLSIWPAESSATPNPCGTTIVADTTLSGDLHCPAGNGIVIGAPGITFDLGGHTLSGTLTGVGVLNDGHANVTVTNGAMVGFANGVQLNGTTANVVQGVSTSGNGAAGILLAAADGNRIEGNSLLCNGLVGPQPGCVSGQRPEGGFGVLVATDVNGDGSDGNLVQGNVVVSTENGIVLDQSNENRILANATSKTAGGMVVAVGLARNQVIGNVTTESLSGIFVTAEDNLDNLIAANVANNNGSAGIAIATGGNRTILWPT